MNQPNSSREWKNAEWFWRMSKCGVRKLPCFCSGCLSVDYSCCVTWIVEAPIENWSFYRLGYQRKVPQATAAIVEGRVESFQLWDRECGTISWKNPCPYKNKYACKKRKRHQGFFLHHMGTKAMRRHREKAASCQQARDLTHHQLCWHLVLELSACRTGRKSISVV